MSKLITSLIIGTLMCLLSLFTLATEVTVPQCYDYLTELVRSSNFPFEYTTKEKVNLLIDTDENEEILAQLNYIKDEKDIPENERTGIIGWIEFHLSDNRACNLNCVFACN